MARVVMVIPPERFRDEELFVTREVLKSAGHDVMVASTRVGRCPGSRGGTAKSDASLGSLDAAAFAALVFVGGGGSKLLWREPDALRLAREAAASGRVVAAICLAPVILANAGLLRGRHATVAGTEAATLETAGATYDGPGVSVDGRIVTANAPKASRRFGEAIAALLA